MNKRLAGKVMVAANRKVAATIISSARAWQQLNDRNKFVRVHFRLKNDAKDGRPAGTLRIMFCRRRVYRYTNAVTGLGTYCISPAERQAEDRRCNVLTVWDVEKFHQLRAAGLGRIAAGRGAYRRINMAQVLRIEPWDGKEK